MLLNPGEGEEIVIGPASMRVKSPSDSEGLFIAEHTFPPGFAGPGLHQHPAMAHAFYVLEGQVRFSVDNAETIAEPGTFVYVPANVTHPSVVAEICRLGAWKSMFPAASNAITRTSPRHSRLAHRSTLSS
jgi:cupin domain